jgi:hypothetical protein
VVDYSPAAVRARLREAAENTDLRQDLRLRYKVDYSPAGVRARLEEVEALRRACAALARAGER